MSSCTKPRDNYVVTNDNILVYVNNKFLTVEL